MAYYIIQGDLIWEYTLSSNFIQQHHDIEPLPNGNILSICTETITLEEATSYGIVNLVGPMSLDMIIEIEPIGTNEAEEIIRGSSKGITSSQSAQIKESQKAKKTAKSPKKNKKIRKK